MVSRPDAGGASPGHYGAGGGAPLDATQAVDPRELDAGLTPEPDPGRYDPGAYETSYAPGPAGAPPGPDAHSGAARPARTPRGNLAAGTLLDGRYHLVTVAAVRGPVVLWQGDDRILARPVAVRVIEHGPDGEPDPDAEALLRDADRLLSAAINSGRLVHPGAASTYDAVTTDTPSGRVSYVVSEWVDGDSLTALLAEGPMRPQRAASIVLAAARVIAAAHARGLVHGDLHPGDVMVTPHGAVKVTDLEVGAAMAAIEGRPGDLSAEAVPDPRDRDLLALGALLYAALTARWPLAADRGLPGPPTAADGRMCTPRQVRAGVPRELEALTLATLRDPRAHRPEITSAETLVGELELLSPGDETLDPDFAPLPGDQSGGSTPGYGPGGYPTGADGAAPGTAAYPVGGYQTAGYAQPGYGNPPTHGGPPGYDSGPRYLDPRRGTPPGGPGGGPPRRRRSLAVPLIALITVAAVALIITLALRDHGGKPNPGPTAGATTAPATPLRPQSIAAFDPEGDGREGDAHVDAVNDGNPNTAWETEGYNQQITATKHGVGLVLDFGRPVRPRSLSITITGGQTTFEIRASANAPAGLAGTTKVEGPTTYSAQTSPMQLATPGPYRYWVVWLTSLPQNQDGKFRGTINEISFSS